MYYVYTDHLGSYNLITDEAGAIKERRSYDAWGRLRNANTWDFTGALPKSYFNRGFTGHEHLLQFGLINMNGRVYDPIVGRMLSPDNFAQQPDNTQSFNRYSYCLNNPLKYTDPSGELYLWDDAIVAGVGFGVGYVGYGLSHGNWGGKAVLAGGIGAGTALLGYYTGGGSLVGGTLAQGGNFAGTFAVNSAISAVMPSANIPLGNNFSISVGPSFGLGPNGFGAGVGVGANYTNGDFSLSASAGVRSFGNGTSETRLGGGLAYTANGQTISAGITSFGGTDPQSIWQVGYKRGDFSFAMANDAWLSGDKFRTASAEIGIGNYRAGFSLYSNNPAGGGTDASGADEWASPIYGCNGGGRGCYNTGQRIYSGAYVGYDNGTTVYRAGVNSPSVQDFFQNGIHRGVSRSPYFKTDYGTPASPYFYYGSSGSLY
jgi:RHS repeat-associated protein